MSDYIIKAVNIKKSFGGVRALRGVNLEIKKGEIHCLAGENGCGKSTLIKIISGYYVPDEGFIEIDGVKFLKLTPGMAIQQGIQVIYQDFSLFPNLTVMENLAFNIELKDGRKIINYRRMRKIAKEAISKIGFQIDLDNIVDNLTVPEKQLIAICRALIYEVKLIIMDEPTTALTKKEVKSLFNVVKKLQEKGIAVLFVSHKLEEVFEISERFTIIRNGENVFTGCTNEIDSSKFAFYMTGREFKDENFVSKNIGDKPLLEVNNLSLKNGFTDISFKLKRGEILGITGLLGSGRTELVLSLFGIYPSDSGEIKIDGKPARIKNVKDAIRSGIGYVPADRLTEAMFLPQSITRNIAIADLDRLTNKLDFINFKKVDNEVKSWINNLSILTKDANLPAQTLSGGNQQKIILARWLATRLSILILNGPTMGVDIGTKYDIYSILRSLAEQGLGIIMISDDFPEIINNCNRILIMVNRKIGYEINTKETNIKNLTEMVTNIS